MVWQEKKTSHFLTWTNIIISKHKHINIYVFSPGKNIVFNLMLKKLLASRWADYLLLFGLDF